MLQRAHGFEGEDCATAVEPVVRQSEFVQRDAGVADRQAPGVGCDCPQSPVVGLDEQAVQVGASGVGGGGEGRFCDDRRELGGGDFQPGFELLAKLHRGMVVASGVDVLKRG